MPEEIYPTTWIADRAIDYLGDTARGDAPFFAFVSFPDPHHPFNPPGKYWDMYDPDDFDLPVTFADHRNPVPPMRWPEANFHGSAEQMTAQTAVYQDEQELKQAMALSAGMITMIDDRIGRIVEALKNNGQYDNTVIVFNSDHGHYLGDYNLLLKGMLASRGLTRVPCIWSDPKDRSARLRDTLASTIDLSATILDRAGLERYHGIQGRSMLPTIEQGAGHRDEVLIEFNDGAPKFGFDRPARGRTLVTKHWRYSMFAGESWGALFDLQNDPRETDNLWDDPAHFETRARLAERLIHHLAAQMDESPVRYRWPEPAARARLNSARDRLPVDTAAGRWRAKGNGSTGACSKVYSKPAETLEPRPVHEPETRFQPGQTAPQDVAQPHRVRGAYHQYGG